MWKYLQCPYGSCCPKCKQPIIVTLKFVKGYVDCPNCNYPMHIAEDEFREVIESIKQQLND